MQRNQPATTVEKVTIAVRFALPLHRQPPASIGTELAFAACVAAPTTDCLSVRVAGNYPMEVGWGMTALPADPA